ncbi:peptide chain release factor 3 [Gracilibacillus boraciitolerans JCM 21714]|uniref:Peptide chain release factor 3 n=1 Tax=Gracilibacillus boraciitolerans JCM 21714 TaxID=1298598 RepID=W4VH59_9BACI|nr:peptide chain release factor 3 [Gracilibacillus boraciitolerans]GAE92740.1 peptide chain release factor 3 [Gracilibacillus boraciitolerans JCM 21714]
MGLQDEVKKRKTFAIISHPDAGKTTMTEKLLLFGNLIRTAGTVKAKKTGKYATSDWMEIEKQRGISVTSSVMNFEYKGHKVNILDTPGHEDFSEDTYRTLTAVDSVVMIIDATKGIEAQTIKLFKVCKMRGIPIFTFINKLDREGREPLELLDQIEDVLNIETYPMNWPVGMGKRFLGILDRYNDQFIKYNGNEDETYIPMSDMSEDELTEHPTYQETVDELALLNEAGDQFSLDRVLEGEQTPVFFGSALAPPFGVQTFFDTFISMAPAPGPRRTTQEVISPVYPDFSGFIFKIQANMNPQHRDRIAFLRVCSGKFERGMNVNVARTGKSIRLGQTQQFVASSRDTVEEAYAGGDIIGIYDPGIYRIGGDTLVESKQTFEFDELPQFPPEMFQRVTAKNVMKAKQFRKGIEQLVQEGAIQLFRGYPYDSMIIGAVGQLQYEVFQHRMKHEYNVEVLLESIGERIPRWLKKEQVDAKLFDERNLLVKDREGEFLVLFKNDFALRWFIDKHPKIDLIDLYEVNQYDQTT